MGLRLFRRRRHAFRVNATPPPTQAVPPPAPSQRAEPPVPSEPPTRLRVVLADGTEAPVPADPELRERIEYLARRIVPPAPPPPPDEHDHKGSGSSL